MIIEDFPRMLSKANADKINYDCFGKENIIVHARTTSINYTRHTAPLSIKWTLKGKEFYEIEGNPITVNHQNFLLINTKQPYSSFIQSEEETKKFSVLKLTQKNIIQIT